MTTGIEPVETIEQFIERKRVCREHGHNRYFIQTGERCACAKLISINDLREFMKGKALVDATTLSQLQSEKQQMQARIAELEKSNEQSLSISRELAEWSRRYPREKIYNSSQMKMDDGLIALEERAKALCGSIAHPNQSIGEQD